MQISGGSTDGNLDDMINGIYEPGDSETPGNCTTISSDDT